MNKFTKETILSLSQLSRIHCNDEEANSLLGDLNKIFDHFETLQSIDTNGIVPCTHVLEGMINLMREDEVGETLPRKEFLDNSPAHAGGLIQVPPVIV